MAAISSLKTALQSIGSNPVLFLGGLLAGLITLPQLGTQLAGIPFVPTVLQVLAFFVTPFVAAGIYGMADEALESAESRTTLSTLTAVGREKYVPLLLANIVELGIVIAFGIVFVIVTTVVVLSIGLGAVAGGGGGDLAIGGGVVIAIVALLLLFLVFVLVNFFIQFFPVAVVVGESGAIESFGESYRLVRNNIVPALGYSVIQLVAGFLVSIPVTGFIFFRTFQNLQDIQNLQNAGGVAPGTVPSGLGFSTTEIVAIAAISLAAQMLLTTFQYTYAVAFFEAHDGGHTKQVGPTGPDIDGESVIPKFE
ncbi:MULTISPECIES: hypothetical protein [Haloferax]|uniref:DUF7847 domain-containing protein n=1 Tax=Haloferax marinum TaxID=2666143 RepID=A0A6A8G4M3_9EURY|nr:MULTISPECIES: hypothetical protein [Haloferax]KAB1196670.1 hypothetical protein Hfx1150_03710 [Haloferax sp. CBA1150]MRW95677.1 hypothetical protein [Haloferax marinum]